MTAPMTDEDFVQHRGNMCPSCRSPDIDGSGRTDTDDNWHTAGMRCLDCGATWSDLYELVGYVGLEVPDQKENR